MINNNKSNQINKIIFPKNIPDIIETILKKYNLTTLSELIEKEISDEELEKKLEELPGEHIAKIIKEFSRGEIKDEASLVNIVKERLNISKELAQQLTKDLQGKILNLLQVTTEEIKAANETEAEEIELDNGPPAYRKPDVYRESIE